MNQLSIEYDHIYGNYLENMLKDIHLHSVELARKYQQSVATAKQTIELRLNVVTPLFWEAVTPKEC